MVAIVIQGDTQGEGFPLWYALIFPIEQGKRKHRNSKAYSHADIAVIETKEFTTPLGLKVRVVMIDGNPWFVGKDVAECLGFKNTKHAIKAHVQEMDKRIFKGSDLRPLENNIPKHALPFTFTRADIPNRGLTIINESGLYSLVLSSKLETAKEFKHWVTSEVLPSIRKHGAYMTDETLEQYQNPSHRKI